MISDVDRAWEFVHREECGGRCRVVNDPADPGGATAHGIARNKNPGAWSSGPPSVAEAHDLFEALYWRTAGCDRLQWPLSLAVADFAFHSGVSRARRMLLRIIGSGESLPTIGNEQARVLALELTAARRAFLSLLPTFARFGRGWLARCDRLEALIREP